MHQHRAAASRLCVLWASIVTNRSCDLVAFLDQFQEMGRLGCGPKVRPVRVLQLRDLSERLERESRMPERKVPHNDIRILSSRLRGFYRPCALATTEIIGGLPIVESRGHI